MTTFTHIKIPALITRNLFYLKGKSSGDSMAPFMAKYKMSAKDKAIKSIVLSTCI